MVVATVDGVDSVAQLREPRGCIRIELAHQIVGLGRNRVDFIAQSEVHCKPGSHTPVVFRKGGIPLAIEGPLKVSRQERGT